MALSVAKNVSKATYSYVPQLDSYGLLVGQDSVPEFGAEKSPVETVSSQICLLEIGLRRGGDIFCLSDIFEVECTPTFCKYPVYVALFVCFY